MSIEFILFVLHMMALICWFGGLFAYLFIIWPAIFQLSSGSFPREMLGVVAFRTAPWIYLGMVTAVASAIAFIWVSPLLGMQSSIVQGYMAVLTILVGNNVFGSIKGWPSILCSPEPQALTHWKWFYTRMALSFIGGFSLIILGLYYVWSI